MFAGKKCNASDFKWAFNFDYGNCFTFNPGSEARSHVKTVSQAGYVNGLVLEMFTGSPGDLGDAVRGSGAVVFLSNDSQPAFANPEIILPNEFLTRIVVNRNFATKLQSSRALCVQQELTPDSTAFFKQIVSLNQSYTQSGCFNLCYQSKCVDLCRCNDPRYTPVPGYPQCLDAASEMPCLYGVYQRYLNADFINECGRLCPEECEKQSFAVSLSNVNYPTESYARVLMENPIINSKFPSSRNISFEELKRQVLSVDIYYDRLEYTQISQVESMSTITLVSNVGGLSKFPVEKSDCFCLNLI